MVAGRAEHVDAVGAPLGRDDELREVEAESVQDDERECPHQLGERVRRGEHGAEDEDGDDRVAPLVAERLVLDDARVGEPGDEKRHLSGKSERKREEDDELRPHHDPVGGLEPGLQPEAGQEGEHDREEGVDPVGDADHEQADTEEPHSRELPARNR